MRNMVMPQGRYVISHHLLLAINHTLIHFIYLIDVRKRRAPRRNARLNDYHKNLTYGTQLN